MEVKCRVCDNTESNTIYNAREMMMGLRERFTYFQCDQCKCIQIADFPENISKYYPDEYYSIKANDESDNLITRFLKLKRNKYAVFKRSLLGKIVYKKYPKPDLYSLSHINLNKDTRILDVGCGTGELLRSLHQLGFQDLTGIDPYNKEEIIEIGGNSKIFKKYIFELEGQWDVIMMHHVFEHMPDPLRVLKCASELLVPNGYFLIRIPVSQSTAWKEYRENWVQLDAPRHFFIHSPISFKLLLKNTDFELIKTIYDSTAFQFWGSIQYENDISLHDDSSYAVDPKRSIFNEQDIASFSKKAKELNKNQKGDQAIFIMRKKNNSARNQ